MKQSGKAVGTLLPRRLGRRFLSAVGGAGVLACSLAGCEKINALIGRSGASLDSPLKTGADTTWRVLVESTAPAGGGAAGTMAARIDLKIRTKQGAPQADNWAPVDGEILEGRYEVDQKPRGIQLAGQKVTFKHSNQRRLSAWQGPTFPAGLELLEIAPPKGRVKKGERWKVETRRLFLQQQQEVAFDKFFTYEGEAQLGAELCDRLSISIPATKRVLATGAQIDFSGSGETWIARKDGRVLKCTEVLDGQTVDEKVPGSAGHFAQAITLMDDGVAPQILVSLIDQTPGGAAGASAPGKAPVPAAGSAGAPVSGSAPAAAGMPQPPAAPASGVPPPAAAAVAPGTVKPKVAMTGTASGDRLIFVSRSTGKAEVWSVGPGGDDKRCLSGFTYEHWAPAMDLDARSFACVARKPSGINLVSVGLPAGDEVQLTEFSEREDMVPGWSLNGQRLVFLRSGKLWSVHRDGFNLQSYAISGQAIQFAATPAHGIIAVVINELNLNKIFSVDVISGAVRELFEGDSPSWAPDGSKFAYRNGETVNVANADGSGPHMIMKSLTQDTPLIWDPAGKRVACTTLAGSDANVVLVNDAEKSPIVKVTSRGGAAATFSPTGDRIAYLRNGDLWIATVDGNVQRRLTEDGATDYPVWWGKIDAR